MKTIYIIPPHHFVAVYGEPGKLPAIINFSGQVGRAADLDDRDASGISVAEYFDKENEEKAHQVRKLIETINLYLQERDNDLF